MWVNGPFPCGEYPDVRIFKKFMAKRLEPDELVIADRGYRHDRCVYNSIHTNVFSKIRARHEIVNRRLKQFSALRVTFRHDLSLHSACFHAIANITKVILDSDPMFDIKHN